MYEGQDHIEEKDVLKEKQEKQEAIDAINVDELFINATKDFINQQIGIGNIDLNKGKDNKEKVNLYGTVLDTKKKK